MHWLTVNNLLNEKHLLQSDSNSVLWIAADHLTTITLIDLFFLGPTQATELL